MRTLAFGKVASSEAHLDRIYRSDRGLLDAPDRSDTALVLRVVWRILILVAFVLLTFPACFGAWAADSIHRGNSGSMKR